MPDTASLEGSERASSPELVVMAAYARHLPKLRNAYGTSLTNLRSKQITTTQLALHAHASNFLTTLAHEMSISP